MCEGWSLKSERPIAEPWCARTRLNNRQHGSLAERRLLGEYLDRQTVMARVEANIESNMQTVLNDWGLYQAAKEKRPNAE